MNCTIPGCSETARYSYSWPWGESGVCCERHRFILEQQASQIDRALSITPLDPGAPAPIGRDERIGYNARILALTEEIQELQGRGVTLTESHQELARQLRTATAQNRTLEAELQLHRERVAELTAQLEASQSGFRAARANEERLTQRLSAYELDTELEGAQSP